MTKTALAKHFEKYASGRFGHSEVIKELVTGFTNDAIAAIPHYEFTPENDEFLELTLDEFFEKVCYACKEDPNAVRSRSRLRHLVICRQIYSLFAKQIFKDKYTLKQLANIIGGRDHTTVIHGVITAKNLIRTNDYEFMEKFRLAHREFEKYFMQLENELEYE